MSSWQFWMEFLNYCFLIIYLSLNLFDHYHQFFNLDPERNMLDFDECILLSNAGSHSADSLDEKFPYSILLEMIVYLI